MDKPKILQILSMYHEEAEQILQKEADVIRTDDYSLANLCHLVKDVEGIILRAPARIPKEVIDANPHLQVISGAGVGLDNIDVAYATKKGIPVLHAPSVNKVSTAEHAVMFIMALSKSIIPFHTEMKQGNYDSRNSIPTYELRGKKVGLIGFGNIAQEVAKRVIFGFEMKVSAWVREYDAVKHGISEQLGVEITTDIRRIFTGSDFVSIHIPLNEKTKHSIDRGLLSLMKPSAFLINTARGAVLHSDDLYYVLSNHKIAGAALDVFEVEPPPPDHPLLKLPNIIVTPHVGGTTMECNYITSTTVVHNVLNLLKGEHPEFVANPSTLKK
ncbi:hydroxyacid dehydrogenase [Paenibacillus beijingensis]|uniref:2-hydroxyacid dehydrogenase n=1 Tax=Paenibacillus beijingensis TaxID=1126833 RepID=A0A0D5NEI8_9BACL|nr:hydroxyacid dehydrogenase [Paenibacillus beijingensis]AJY73794.1 2-hydroxyacid dehydrogenase [Paenibacillus beijingensis]